MNFIGLCHHCDNPRCVRPDHLFLGTGTDNQNDCVSKGRMPSMVGELNGNARLTVAEVSEIREAKGAGAKTKDLAARFGVTTKSILNIWHGETW